MAGLAGPVRATYEAGPAGFALARRLEAAGVDCLVCAPGLIPRGPSDRVKTDQRDAERLVRLLVAGELAALACRRSRPRALRDLVRAREDLRGDLMRARHRAPSCCSATTFASRARSATGLKIICGGYRLCASSSPAPRPPLMTIAARLRRWSSAAQSSSAEIAEQLPLSPWAQTARRLMCLRGIDTLTAAGLCAEVGDFHRFGHPEQLMSYLGVVPSEHSSGARRRHRLDHQVRQPARPPAARRGRLALSPAATGQRALRRRQTGADAAIVALSWKTQRRLHRVWTRMERRGKRRTIIAVAAARELAGFCWAIDHRLTRADTTLALEAAGTAGPSRQSIRDTPMGSRTDPVTPDARRRALRRNPVLRYPTRAYQC